VLVANVTDAAIATVLALLTWQDALDLPILFTLAALHGAVRVFNQPALSSIAPNIVPPRLLPRAIAMSSIAWQSGSVVGPFVGGVLFERSPSLPHFLSAGLLVASALLIVSLPPIRAKHEGPPRHPLKQMADGFHFVRKERFLLGCITLDLFAVLLAGATALLPVYARDILGVGADGLGLMRGAIAFGAAIMALLLSFRPLETNVGEKMLWAVVIFGAATIGFGLSREFWLSLGLLAILGGADMVSVFIRSSLVQLYTPDDKRGRVSAISGLAISASNELGELQSGLAAAILGVTGAVVFGGAGAIAVAALWAWLYPELRHARTFAVKYHEDDRPAERETQS
jgi:MFS family permease